MVQFVSHYICSNCGADISVKKVGMFNRYICPNADTHSAYYAEEVWDSDVEDDDNITILEE